MIEDANNLNESSKDILEAKIPRFLEDHMGITSKNFQVLCWVPTLYQGWEMDEWAALIQVNGSKMLLHSDHGALYQVEYP